MQLRIFNMQNSSLIYFPKKFKLKFIILLCNSSNGIRVKNARFKYWQPKLKPNPKPKSKRQSMW